MNNILWIEDSSTHDLSHIAVPIWTDPIYGLTIANDISTAVMHLHQREFQTVIFDLRLPPGTDLEWIRINDKLVRQKEPPRLGIYLLSNLFNTPYRGMKVNIEKPVWLTQDRVGILSVDHYSDVKEFISQLGLSEMVYKQKTAGMPRTALKTLVKEILQKGL